MKLVINTEAINFFCTRAAEPRTDRETGVVRTDRETGQPLWQVQLAALDSSGGEVLNVSVPGEPQVTVGEPVTVERLVAIPWVQGDRSGVAYRAKSIYSGTASKSSSPKSDPSGQPGKSAS